MSTASPDRQVERSQNGDEPRFVEIRVTDERIIATFSDDRILSVPLSWSWRLAAATPAQRANYQVIGAGHTAYWPDIDEHLSVEGFFHGAPAPRPSTHVAATRKTSAA